MKKIKWGSVGDNDGFFEYRKSTELGMGFSGSVEEFKKLHRCSFVSEPNEYPELKKNVNAIRDICKHTCRSCARQFYGYKRRDLCLDCDRIDERLSCQN